MHRKNGRAVHELRRIQLQPHVLTFPKGSVMVSYGATKVLCTAIFQEESRNESAADWLTVTYAQTPHAARKPQAEKAPQTMRDIAQNIAHCIRAVTDESKLENRTLSIACTVLQADGGSEAASLTGAWLATQLAITQELMQNKRKENPLTQQFAAVSVGATADGEMLVDLDEEERRKVPTQMTIAMTETGHFLTMQAQGEQAGFSGETFNALLFLAKTNLEHLLAYQKEALFPVIEQAVTDKTILIASRNKGKAQEFQAIFGQKGYNVKTLLDYPELPEVEETGQTFEENARLKAETIANILQCPVLADDSGLAVDALNGLPGIYSARFAGEQKSDAANNAKLLYELTDVPKGQRQATFHCTLVLAAPHKQSLVATGEWKGEIATIPHGHHGFGYDPLFYLPDLGKTAAELTGEEKNQMSHRAQAVAALKQHWEEWMEESVK